MQIEQMRLYCETEHGEAVVNGGALPVKARLPLAQAVEGNCVIGRTP